MGSDHTKKTIRLLLSGVGLCLTLALAACGSSSSDSGDPGSANPSSNLTAAKATEPIKGAPPELASIRQQANTVIDQSGAFEKKLASLEAAGIPVVVNKWASWCGPCRAEFPDFQSAAIKYGDKVAFIGLNSNDGVDTARTFLTELPVPYPSYEDQSGSLDNSIGANVGQPNTIFIDGTGKTVYRQLGPYAEPGDLDSDIEK
ncbi:hypothetical protein BH10ACT11_BH10ACT11_05210 [soil metagenome]